MRGSTALCRAATIALLLAIAGPAAAQIRLDAPPVDSASRVVARVLDRGDYTVIDRDTILGKSVVIPNDLVVTDGAVRLEGRVDGAIAVISGELYVRPGAIVEGPIAVIQGGAYGSGLAMTGPIIEVDPRNRVETWVDTAGYAFRVLPPDPPRRFSPTGIFGFSVPTYDRVNGLTLGWGTRLLLGRDPQGAALRATATWAAERNRFGGSAGLDLPIADDGWTATFTVGRGTQTHDAWVRGDLVNSVSAFLYASDLRNYYDSDRAEIGVARRRPQPIIQGERFIGPRLLVRVSRDRSIAARDPWTVAGEWRENPPIDDGTIVSGLLGFDLGWRGRTSRFDGDTYVEWSPFGAGDHNVAQAVGDGTYTMAALWRHSIATRARVMLSLHDAPQPRQRWGILGGPATLPTLAAGELFGDNLLFLRTDYRVPLGWPSVPLMGPPALRISHAAGTAWLSGDPFPELDQNLGAGLDLGPAHATLWIDPAAVDRDVAVSFGVAVAF